MLSRLGGLSAPAPPQLDVEPKAFSSASWLGDPRWLSQGEQSRWEKPVREFVDGFRSGGRLDYEAMCRRIFCDFRVVYRTPEEMMGEYCRRSASEIIAGQDIHVVGELQGRHLISGFPRVDGCVERALAAATALRCGGMPAGFVRWRGHSLVFTRRGDDVLAASWRQTELGRKVIHTMEKEELAGLIDDLKLRRRQNVPYSYCRIGLDPADIGMRSIRDYWISMGLKGMIAQDEFNKSYPDETPKE